ncbi:MAG: hypothetical protein DBX55_02540 [Verrucomicrobia bacterium]|nr:MAG: hypothetical protein DBX55_02540 [Verrucomicrobiota bacterium]
MPKDAENADAFNGARPVLANAEGGREGHRGWRREFSKGNAGIFLVRRLLSRKTFSRNIVGKCVEFRGEGRTKRRPIWRAALRNAPFGNVRAYKKGVPRKGNALVAYRLEGSVVSFLRFLLPIPARVLAQYVYMRVRA